MGRRPRRPSRRCPRSRAPRTTDRPVRLGRRRVPAGASRRDVATVEPLRTTSTSRSVPSAPPSRARRGSNAWTSRGSRRSASVGTYGTTAVITSTAPLQHRGEWLVQAIPRTPRRGCDGRIAPRSGPAPSRRPVLEAWPRPSRPRSLRRRCTDRRPRPWAGAATPRGEPTLRSASAARRRPARTMSVTSANVIEPVSQASGSPSVRRATIAARTSRSPAAALISSSASSAGAIQPAPDRSAMTASRSSGFAGSTREL